MKKNILFLIVILLYISANAQSIRRATSAGSGGTFLSDGMEQDRNGSHWADDNDSIDKSSIPVGIYVWTIDKRFGNIKAAQPDTLSHLFQNDAFTEGRYGEYNTTGNLGSPRVSRIYNGQQDFMMGSQFVFEKPYDFFLQSTDQLLFTNTKSPITNITYHECGNKTNGEDRIRALFATNVNKKLGLGFKLDYLYGRGYYASQSSSAFCGNIYGSYRDERYQLHTYYDANHLKNTENGGIENDDYVVRPEIFPTHYRPADMPVRLQKTWNKMNVNTFFLTHRYSVGYHQYKDSANNVVNRRGKVMGQGNLSTAAASDSTNMQAHNDSTLTEEFVPVVSFIHTLRLAHNNRRFISNLHQENYFSDFYLPGDSASDFTKNIAAENLFAIEMKEGVKKWVKTGMRLYAKHEFSKFTLPDEQKRTQTYTENYITLGAQLLKEQGKIFHYNTLGEIRTTGGTDWGEFNVEGDLGVTIPFKKDSLEIKASGFVRNELPSFYYRHYHAQNAWWDNDDLKKTFRTRIGGSLRYRDTQLSFGIESIQNYTCFAERQEDVGTEDQPSTTFGMECRQSNKNIQVISAALWQSFRWGPLNWETEFTFQKSSDETELPLPSVNAWTNVYLLFRIAKVLRTELGADLRYFTKYYAPAYSPIIGQYCQQDETHRVKTGNYPFINVYVNFHLKNTRFYIMASHVNGNSGGGNYFLTPHYPTNQMIIRFGVSWNFFN